MKQTMLFLLCSLFIISCDHHPSADEIDSQRQEKLQAQGQAQAGLPAITNFQEKKLLKSIYEMRDNEKLICYAYLFNEFQGKLVYLGKCMGYGIPYSTQYSNPEKEEESSEHGYLTLPQAEPNGLFMPASSSGTWVMLIDDAGSPHPVYIEPNVIVSPFKLNLQ
jgi:hypothetical protein